LAKLLDIFNTNIHMQINAVTDRELGEALSLPPERSVSLADPLPLPAARSAVPDNRHFY